MERFKNESKAFKIGSFSRLSFFSIVMTLFALPLLLNVAKMLASICLFFKVSSHSRRMFLSFIVCLRRMRHHLASTSGLEPLCSSIRGLSFPSRSPFLSPCHSFSIGVLHSRHITETDFNAGLWRQHMYLWRAVWRIIPATMFVVPEEKIQKRRCCLLMSF